ncbi:P-loop containing nucleoside triphosphate hydrolase protein [Dunaliella salina]|uniref:P-loop containing nucleoside triphosphate hydrolase protein n=1 Tax=Dunaliella salina TaxID=3046 RepID=A0ABQ7FZI6_DUNSA|nr:P-loop containing nucleoside triphosphate hydrolase protein [Dunaliella salina]|eukprot:KAF5827761.1 P-loop containing nucleoside triphosphate hydrolase protein [Dunaliella salina]
MQSQGKLCQGFWHGRPGIECFPTKPQHLAHAYSSETRRLSRSATMLTASSNLAPATGGHIACSTNAAAQQGRLHIHAHSTSTNRASLVGSCGSGCSVACARRHRGKCNSSSSSRRSSRVCSVAGGGGGSAGAPGGGPLADALADMAKQLQALAEEQARAERAAQEARGGAGAVSVRNLSFHPPGSETPLIKDVSMKVPPNSLGLIIGRSGSGKTTLLQLLAGLCEQTSGDVSIVPSSFPDPDAAPPLSLEARMAKVGLVFQFPERHFLGSDIFSELTFSWPRDPAFFMQQQILRARVEKVLRAVRLEGVPMARSPWALSGGQQRRLALAIQLVRQPALLLLDEPLAGLDWEARMEVVELLQRLKEECTLLVVSHDLKEVAPLVDNAWSMKLGGTLEPVQWPQSPDQ